ncbi:MAG TPA: hypothetical protein VJ827_05925 [Rubrobacter sp.]|nr:hypothetical protein [Rubrobacter sp.]
MLSNTGLNDVTQAFDPDAVTALPGWECIPTPGHVSFFRRSDRVLIAGEAVSTVNLNSLRDFVLQKQKLSEPAYITTWNWRTAKDSIAILARLDPRVIAGTEFPCPALTLRGLCVLLLNGLESRATCEGVAARG